MFAPHVRAQSTSPPRLVHDAGGESGTAAVGKADDQPPTNAKAAQPEKKTKKKTIKKAEKKENKNAAADSSDENVTRPKHPSWSPVPAVKVEFKARIESELRTDTPASGFEDSDLEWQDRRIGVEGTAFKRIAFEISKRRTISVKRRRGKTSTPMCA